MKVKKFKYIILILLILIPGVIFSWGEEGHKLIGKLAMQILPDEMRQYREWQDYVSEHSSDADNRKGIDSTEGPKHYIDIDYYHEFEVDSMIYKRNELESIYSDSLVTKMGILPWATLETYNKLVKAFKEKNRDKTLIFLADLSHYVADGHQPMHTMVNYNGQLTGQKGIHGRYEIEMFDKNLDNIKEMFEPHKISYVENKLNFIFNYLTEANSYSPVLYSADTYAFKLAGSRNSEEYYRLLWFKTKYVTVEQVSEAASDLASLIYSAWIDAGKPPFDEMK